MSKFVVFGGGGKVGCPDMSTHLLVVLTDPEV